MRDGTTGWRDLDHLEVAGMDDPAPLLQELRAQAPIGRSDAHGGFWVIAGYDDVRAAAQNPSVFSSAVHRAAESQLRARLLSTPMIHDDAPRHRDLRQPLQSAFSARSAEAMAPMIRAICRGLVDEFVERGEADLVTELAAIVPPLVVFDLLDLPADDREALQMWTRDAVALGSSDSIEGIFAYADALYDERRGAPGDDIPSSILTFTVDARPITRDEWVGMVVLLILAGLDTTANGAALLLHLLGTRPDVRASLREDPTRIPAAVEEGLRFLSPVPQHSREVRRDVEVAGCPLHAGDVVHLSWLAANRDPAEFPGPDTFVPDRNPNRHLAFGAGEHRCLGLHLARVELREIVEEILLRLPDYRLVDGGTVRYGGLNRDVSNLRVTFTPGPRLARA
jgi:cytochrome P450